MDIPNLPTDNLYKFMALSGVLIMIVCIIIPALLLKDLNKETSEINVDIELLRYETELLAQDTMIILKNINDINEEFESYKFDKELISKDLTAEEIIGSIINEEHREVYKFYFEYRNQLLPGFAMKKEMNEKKKEMIEKTKLFLVKSKLLNLKNEELERKRNSMRSSLILCMLGIFAGMVLAHFGFRLWYYRVQIYLDKKLANEATKEL